MKNFVHTALFALILILAAGCWRRPLYDMDDKIAFKVTVDVDTVANIKANIYNEQLEKPSTNTDVLRVMAYDPSNHILITQGFLSEKSYDAAGHQVFDGTLHIAQGNFDFLIYNAFDAPSITWKDENNIDNILANTASGTKAEDSKVYDRPDHLMVARLKNYRIAPHDEVMGVSATAYTCINTYYIQIRVDGLQYVSSATATVSGLYSGNYFGRDKDQNIGIGERVSDPLASVTFRMEKSTDKHIAGENKDVLCALFNTFGKVRDMNSNFDLTITDTGGNTLQYSYSLNLTFRTEDAIERHWLLLDDIVVVPNPRPVPPVDNGGFKPQVDDWEVQHGEITL